MAEDKEHLYYPACIDQQKTQHQTQLQVSIISKIIHGMTRRIFFSQIIFQQISSFCFTSPIRFRESIFKLDPKKQVRSGSFWLINLPLKSCIQMEILGIWHRKQLEANSNRVLVMGHHLLQFLNITNFEINTVNENEKKWTLACQNKNLYFDLINILKGYKKSGKINEETINSFKYLVYENIILFRSNGLSFIYIGQQTLSIWDKKVNKEIQFSFLFSRENVYLDMSYEVAQKVSNIQSRNQQIFIWKGKMYLINDIFILQSQYDL